MRKQHKVPLGNCWPVPSPDVAHRKRGPSLICGVSGWLSSTLLAPLLHMLSWQQMASFTVYLESYQRSTEGMRNKKEKNAWRLCTPPPTLEAFSTKVSASTNSYFERVGLLKKTKNMMTRNREIACEWVPGPVEAISSWSGHTFNHQYKMT